MEHLWIGLSVICIFLVDNYLFKVNNENTRTMLEICSKLTIKIPERRYWRCSGFIVKFEQISHIVLVFPLLRWTGKHKQNYFCWFQQKHFRKNSLSRKVLLTTSGRLNSWLVSIDLNEEMITRKKEFCVHCVKSVRIQSFSGLYFPTFGLNMDQENSEYGQFPRRGSFSWIFWDIKTFITYKKCHFQKEHWLKRISPF